MNNMSDEKIKEYEALPDCAKVFKKPPLILKAKKKHVCKCSEPSLSTRGRYKETVRERHTFCTYCSGRIKNFQYYLEQKRKQMPSK